MTELQRTAQESLKVDQGKITPHSYDDVLDTNSAKQQEISGGHTAPSA